MAASSIDCIFTGSRGHLDEGRKVQKTVFKLATFLKKRFQIRGRSTARITSFYGSIAIASQESIAHMQSPWPCWRLGGRWSMAAGVGYLCRVGGVFARRVKAYAAE